MRDTCHRVTIWRRTCSKLPASGRSSGGSSIDRVTRSKNRTSACDERGIPPFSRELEANTDRAIVIAREACKSLTRHV